ncbi:MAG: hypothetical protein H6Q71_1198 [Firmicutes bacterium]|nr:hypothetical protein [Bacillota bacterium]
MKKLQLLEQIDKLSSLLHSDDLQEFNFTAGTISEMRMKSNDKNHKKCILTRQI